MERKFNFLKGLTNFKRVLSPFLGYGLNLLILGTIFTYVLSVIQVITPILWKNLVDAIYLEQPSKIKSILLFVLLLSLSRFVFSLLSGYMLTKWKEESLAKVQSELFRRIMGFPLSLHTQKSEGYFLSFISYEVPMVQSALFSLWNSIFRDFPLFMLFALILVKFFGKLSIPFLVLPIFLSIFTWLVSKISKRLNESIQGKMMDFYDTMEEGFSGVESIKALGGESSLSEKFMRRVTEYAKEVIKFQALHIFQGNSLNLISTLLVVVFLGLVFYFRYPISPGDVVFLVLVSSQYFSALQGLVSTWGEVRGFTPFIYRLSEILSYPMEENKGEDIFGVDEIYIGNLYYGYREGWILRVSDLQFKKGERVFITGPSGSGKTTFAKLLSGLLEFQRGEVFINGKPIEGLSSRKLRKVIRYVPQEPFIFTATLKENILFPQKDEVGALQEVLETVKLKDKVGLKGEGLEYMCGRGGLALSGGERQRINLARNLINGNFDVIILDETLREVDVRMEEEILKMLFSCLSNKTIIYISHRLNCVDMFDKVIVLDKGEVVCYGKPQELSKNCGFYKGLVKRQNKEVLDVARYSADLYPDG